MKIAGKTGLTGESAHSCWHTGVSIRGACTLAVLLFALGCQEPPPAPAVADRVAPLSGPARVALGPEADLGLAQSRVVVRGVWGAGPGQFGRDEAGARPGPLSLAVDRATGVVHVLDQENGRVQRFSPEGTRLAPLTGISGTTEDIVVAGGAVWSLAYQPDDPTGRLVHRLGAQGPELTVPLRRDLGATTGIFASGPASAPDLWVEQDQDTQLRVVREGQAVPPSAQVRRALGRPDIGHPGRRVTARLAGSHAALVMSVDPERGLEPVLELVTPVPLVAIQELYTDSAGTLYIGLFMAAEGPPPSFEWSQVRKVVVAWRPGAGHRVIQMAPYQDTMVYRPLAVGHDGALYQLHTTEAEVVVRRWAPPLSPGEVRP